MTTFDILIVAIYLSIKLVKVSGQDPQYGNYPNYGDGNYPNYGGGNYPNYGGGNYPSYGNYSNYPYYGNYSNYPNYGNYSNYPNYGNYSNYPNYGNYSNYPNYGNYSDYGGEPHPAQNESCGGELTELQGEIVTPGYPSQENPNGTYPPFKDCYWYRDGADSLVQLKFWDLEIEIGEGGSNVTCDFDYVNVTITSVGSKRYCGYHLPPEESKGVGRLDIHFRSDSSVNYRGFVATYRITENYDPCQPNPCVYGTCNTTDDGTLPLCDCEPGYKGDQCHIDIRECNSNPCQNGGRCYEPEPAMYRCQCPRGYEGDNCEIGDGVQEEEEEDKEEAKDEGAKDEEEGAAGGSKQEQSAPPNPCDSHPCKNGGTCISGSGEDEYDCQCKEFYEGDNCEIETGCKNPGIPQIDESKRFASRSRVQISCDDGFNLEGEDVLTCHDDGSWSHDMPECVGDPASAAARQKQEGGNSSWQTAVVGLGVALGIVATLYGVWLIQDKPWLQVGSGGTAPGAGLKANMNKADTISISTYNISSDESDEDERPTKFSSTNYIDVP